MDSFIIQFAKIFPEFNLMVGTGLMIFVRFLGFMQFAPIMNRKEIPIMMRVSFAFIMTIAFTLALKPVMIPDKTSIMLCLFLNFLVGAFIGFIAQCIMSAVSAAGDMMNTQMGMSSAMIMDPTTRSQTSIMSRYINLLGIVIFMNIGGLYWLFRAFLRSFDIFGVYAVSLPLEQIINPDYLILLTSNVLYIGLQIASPVLLATLGQDIILGIISKTAPQVNVFQLSFLFKPVLGATILIWIMPMLVNVIEDFFTSYAQIF